MGSILKTRDLAANALFSIKLDLIPPVVISSVFIKEIIPMTIVETPHAELHSSGWKFEKLMQIGVLT